MRINFFNQTKENTKDFQKLISKVLNNIKNNKEFNIIFVEDDEIKRINKEFRNIDRVTDVISFALCDDINNEMIDDEYFLTVRDFVFNFNPLSLLSTKMLKDMSN